jgi:phospholipid-binding lipoprotein MlaA
MQCGHQGSDLKNTLQIRFFFTEKKKYSFQNKVLQIYIQSCYQFMEKLSVNQRNKNMLRATLVSSLLVMALSTPCLSETSTTAAPAEVAVSGADTKEQSVAVKAEETVLVKNESTVENAAALETEKKADTASETLEQKDKDEEESTEICDPIAPVNEAIFHFNDKLYYWGLKPVATGFSYVVPEFARIGFSNAFSNLRSPVNIINNLLQLEFSRSFLELVRLLFNSVVGVGGFIDASSALLGIEKQEADFGQTLGKYGVGQGCYLVLPILGPTSFRDGIGLTGDMFMSPPTYLGYFFLNFLETSGAFLFERVNSTSFKIGDYEHFMNMSVDPYLAQRNAFVQYRSKKVKDAVNR